MADALRRVFETSEGRFFAWESGPSTGPLALCLHGYPDTPLTWRGVARPLAQAGWRVVCPFLRGFAPTEVRSKAVGPAALGRDANVLHQALGADERAILVGHDWGAAAAYSAVEAAPDHWARIVVASWPPSPATIDMASFDQMRRSWYVFLFQLDDAERLVGERNFVRYLWEAWAPGFDGVDYADAAAVALAADSGRLVLEHYRALFRKPHEGSFSSSNALPARKARRMHRL
jgi:pimeloyl-ACP methyl ester carboxylesterase